MKKLEAYKEFAYVAWALVVIFALFTYKVVLDVNKNLEELSANSGGADIVIDHASASGE